ncbi:MAG: FAD-binding oxidoreductase [Gammaproteobacteria bacterium]
MAAPRRVVVIGAGIVGVSCALWLQRGGWRVTLLDGNAPGSGASRGNACTIAVHGCIPVNRPRLPLQLPKLLFGAHRPLSIAPLYAARRAGWLLRFLSHCRAREVAKTRAALAALLAHAHDGLQPLVAAAQCAHLLKRRGCLYVYASESEYRADAGDMRRRREHGIRCTDLDAAAVRELEPALALRVARGVWFEDAQQVTNPQKLTEALFERFRRDRGDWRNQNAAAVMPAGRGVETMLAGGGVIKSDLAVVAAGAFSTRIGGVDRLPLETERGYHVEFDNCGHLARRPVHWAGSGFYACPTDAGLRIAGTVELASLSAPPNRAILAYLTRMAKRMFALDGAPQRDWLGFRPTLPDALPVIGASARAPGILLAFGHQHLGLTLAGITGRLIAQLAAGAPNSVDLAPYAATRFAARVRRPIPATR